jgi:apolipoprotein N-acyltransferase
MSPGSAGRGRRAARLVLLPLVGGALVGLSLPPFGWWPLGIAGVALLASALFGENLTGRLAVGLLAGFGQFFISIAWALQFNTAGYVVLSILETVFFVVACAVVPPGRGRLPAAAAALTLAEWARQTWPFGGLPLGGIALGQANGPLAPTARLGGSLLVAGVTFLAGTSLAALAASIVTSSVKPGRRRDGTARAAAGPAQVTGGGGSGKAPLRPAGLAGLLSAVGGIAVAIGLVIAGRTVSHPSAHTTSAGSKVIRVALVQGGGKRGLNQLEVPASTVFAAAVRETSQVPPGVSLILWPEDVVSINRPLAGSPQEAVLASIARRHHATLVAGVTEPVGTTLFRNEIVAFSPSGRIVAEFEKVHRVPFGEYVPWRGFFSHFANLKDVSRDAIPGHGTGMIATPAGRFAVLVSYEVFFADRGRSGVRAGGEVVLVPTNTSSYSNDQAPAQEIAASRLQAIEQGRYVLQAAPTGYSAVVDPAGEVLARTGLSVSAVLVASVPLLKGSTVFVNIGDVPALTGCLVALGGGWLLALSGRGRRRRRRRRSPSP